MIECARKCIESGPEGSLRVCRNKNTAQYYVRDVSSGNRWEYVSKNKWEKVQKLAQKEYAEQVLKKAQHSLKIIEKLIKSYQPDELTDVYNKLVPGRQQLVKPYIYTDEMMLSRIIADLLNPFFFACKISSFNNHLLYLISFQLFYYLYLQHILSCF